MIMSLYTQLKEGKLPCFAHYKHYTVDVDKADDETGVIKVEFTNDDCDYPDHKLEYYVGDNYENLADRASEIAKDAQDIINDFI